MAGTLPKCGNGGVSDAVTSELGDGQSSHPVKTLLQYYGKSLEALPGVAYPGFRDNRSTLNTKTGFKKKKSPLLTVRHTLHTLYAIIGDIAFPAAAARFRYSLLQHVTSSSSLEVFKYRLKTQLFTVAYVTVHLRTAPT